MKKITIIGLFLLLLFTYKHNVFAGFCGGGSLEKHIPEWQGQYCGNTVMETINCSDYQTNGDCNSEGGSSSYPSCWSGRCSWQGDSEPPILIQGVKNLDSASVWISPIDGGHVSASPPLNSTNPTTDNNFTWHVFSLGYKYNLFSTVVTGYNTTYRLCYTSACTAPYDVPNGVGNQFTLDTGRMPQGRGTIRVTWTYTPTAPTPTNTPTPNPSPTPTPTGVPVSGHIAYRISQNNCSSGVQLSLNRLYNYNPPNPPFLDESDNPNTVLQNGQSYNGVFQPYVCSPTPQSNYQIVYSYYLLPDNKNLITVTHNAIDCGAFDFLTINCPSPTPTPTLTPTTAPTFTPTPTLGPWIKLSGASFQRTQNIVNQIPGSPIAYESPLDTTDSYFIVTNPNSEAGAATINSTNNPDFGFGSVSSRNWISTFEDWSGVSTNDFVSYVKARKQYNTITDLSTFKDLQANTINYTTGSIVISNANVGQFVGKATFSPFVLIVDGGTVSITADNFNYPTEYPLAIIVANPKNLGANLSFANNTVAASGVFVADWISTGSNPNQGLRIKGNLITPRLTNNRAWQLLANRKPSVFVVQDMNMYMKMLGLFSESTYEWSQLQ